MLTVLLAAVVGGVIGALRRPLGAHLMDPRVLAPGVAVVAVVLHLSLALLSPSVAGPLLGLSLFLLTGFALLNLHLVGMGVLAIGLGLNAAVVLVNGAMPVRASAVVAAGIARPGELVLVDLGAGRRYEAVADWLPVLGDVIPVGPLGAVMSFGDLIVLAGIGAVACDLVRYARRPQPGSGRAAPRYRFAAKPVGEHGIGREPVGIDDGLLDGEELHGGRDVVHPEHGLGDGRRHGPDGREGPGVALPRRGGGDGADEVLARQRQQQRSAELGDAGDPVDEVEGLPGRLGEVDARVEEHLLT